MELTGLQCCSVLNKFNSAGMRGVFFLYPLTCTSIFTYRICATLGGFSEMSIHLYQTSWRHHTTHVMHWITSQCHMAISYIYSIQLSMTWLWISSFHPFFLIYVFLLLFISLISHSFLVFGFKSPFFFTLFVSFLCSISLLAWICIVFI